MVPKHATQGPDFAETVTTVFRHEIPNVDRRTMVALVVTYPQGGGRPSIATLLRRSSTRTCCRGGFGARSMTDRLGFGVVVAMNGETEAAGWIVEIKAE